MPYFIYVCNHNKCARIWLGWSGSWIFIFFHLFHDYYPHTKQCTNILDLFNYYVVIHLYGILIHCIGAFKIFDINDVSSLHFGVNQCFYSFILVPIYLSGLPFGLTSLYCLSPFLLILLFSSCCNVTLTHCSF